MLDESKYNCLELDRLCFRLSLALAALNIMTSTRDLCRLAETVKYFLMGVDMEYQLPQVRYPHNVQQHCNSVL